ncbi:hypothetical protein BBJ29_003593 [Phytophthora kernoviae]|uniref:Uncharacterized protein n=1 Tax=Phytophthora kernoviae TaxID=325452 RepID=A0A3F2RRU4_9STRA|nr:hypothetical protein BBP00_00004422 [Phytophthora kernoviae]RLN65492.1 hypothetical protein BBJ29_003593 [Phytophthora kernoviae]
MSSDGVFMLTEAFTESEAGSTEPDDEQQTIVIVEDLDSPPKPLPEAQRSALQATLGVASSAANFVLFPYIVAGKAAVQATSMVVAAPRALTNHVKASITQSWSYNRTEEQADLFGEHSRTSTSSTSDLSSGNEQAMDLFIVDEEEVQEQQKEESGVVSQLLCLPVRLVYSGVSTAVAIPTRVVSYSGRKISGAVSTSHALATSAVVASTGAVAPERCFSEEDCVGETRAAVKMLVKLLGPQNAFYLLKYIYETVNSEEAYDAFLLCRDILHESLDGQNYRRAGASVGAATGITKVVHVMKEAYSVLPSFDELLDAAALVVDVSDEVVDGVTHVVVSTAEDSELEEEEKNSARFEYVDEDEEPVEDRPVGRVFTAEAFESSSLSDDEMNPILESGISLLTRVCDSEEASSLFNTFGDFLDVLVD